MSLHASHMTKYRTKLYNIDRCQFQNSALLKHQNYLKFIEVS